MKSIQNFLQEDIDELGHVSKVGSKYISKIDRSNFNPALRGILTIMYSRKPTKHEVDLFNKFREQYAKIKSQFIDNANDLHKNDRQYRKAIKKSNITWMGFNHTKQNIVRFKMEYNKQYAWKGTLDIKSMKVSQNIEPM
jgi:hypothetical protein